MHGGPWPIFLRVFAHSVSACAPAFDDHASTCHPGSCRVWAWFARQPLIRTRCGLRPCLHLMPHSLRILKKIQERSPYNADALSAPRYTLVSPFVPVYASVEGIPQSQALSKVEVEGVYEPQGHGVITACVHGHNVRYSCIKTQQQTVTA